jgi:molecular chaperone GrpE
MDNIQNNDTENIQPASEDLQKKLDHALSGWKRTAADFDNYRRRKEEENKELVAFAREVAVAKLLPTLDSLEQALRHMPEISEKLKVESEKFTHSYLNWQNGVKGILVQLDQALAELGVRKIEALGKKFDPHFHEAVREVEGEEDGVVTEELQSGFELNGKVIRPSQVTISKRK